MSTEDALECHPCHTTGVSGAMALALSTVAVLQKVQGSQVHPWPTHALALGCEIHSGQRRAWEVDKACPGAQMEDVYDMGRTTLACAACDSP